MESSRAPGRAGLSCHQQWDDWGRFAPGTPGIALVFAVLLRFGFLTLVVIMLSSRWSTSR